MNKLIRHLIELDEKRNGKKTGIEQVRLYQWVFDECLLRWPQVTKRKVWNMILEIEDDKATDNL